MFGAVSSALCKRKGLSISLSPAHPAVFLEVAALLAVLLAPADVNRRRLRAGLQARAHPAITAKALLLPWQVRPELGLKSDLWT